MNLLSLLKQRFSTALSGLVDSPADYLPLIRPAGDPKFGDYQANCAMPLAKVLGKPAKDIAGEIVSRLDVNDICHAPEIAGPGFINLKFKDEFLLQQFVAATIDERVGVEKSSNPQTVIIDYSSPNVAKPMHVGHLRSSVIGAALDKLFRFLGHHVTSDNHIGDWGTQFGMIIYGYKNFLDEAAYKANPVGELSRLYRLVNQLSDFHELKNGLPKLEATVAELTDNLATAEAAPLDKKDKAAAQKLKDLRNALTAAKEEVVSAKSKIASVETNADLSAKAQAHPEIARLARVETAKLHQNDAENLALWHKFLPECLKAMDQVYDRLDIKFDMTLGESYYQPMLADVVSDLEQRALAKESQGAMCVFIEDNPAPFIVRKADGAYTYATTDLATIQDRVERLHANTILYVVDARQSEHFQLLFKTAALWKYPHATLKHISFGTVMGEDRKPYKTRSGDTVGLESLLDEAVVRAKAIVEENESLKRDEDAKLSSDDIQLIAQRIGIGGIKYADLKHHRESDYVFNWDKMLAKKGDTATYIQYAYARVCSIFRKGNIDREQLRHDKSFKLTLTEPLERAMVIKILRFEEILEDAAADYRPNILCQYLFEIADLFSAFFDQHHVLNADNETVKKSRLKLCDMTARVMNQGLSLLGIETIEQM
jgi:arginyl-tRNA synthetase